MKIFISYAHVDEYRVRELVDILRDSEHEPWFDHRLTVGRTWEDQILEAIRACDRFLYALTPESVESKWCQWEFAQAVHAGKAIVPVLVQETPLSGILGRVQYADFSKGPTPRGVAKLLAGISNAQTLSPQDVLLLPAPHTQPERPVETNSINVSLAHQLYGDAYAQFRAKDYAEARDLLHDCLYIDAHHVEAQKLLVVVERRLAEHSSKQRRSRVVNLLPPPFEWIEIPAGKVTLEDGHGVFDVPAFVIAKYPITNAQYAKFVEAGGYQEQKWWTAAGWQQREEEDWMEPRLWQGAKWNGAEYPVVGVSWYEAVAFCRWLGETSGEPVRLPTEQQWQRAAQGDDDRLYPWGNEFDASRCNVDGQGTTPVTQYPNGASSYGVMDMSGNVWEWCLNDYETPAHSDLTGDARRVVRGGSWDDSQIDARCTFRFTYAPYICNYNLGFRVVSSF